MKKLLILILLLSVSYTVNCQITERPVIDSAPWKFTRKCCINNVIVTPGETSLEIYYSGDLGMGINLGTYIEFINPDKGTIERLQVLGLTSDLGYPLPLGKIHYVNRMTVHFPPLPLGVDEISMIEPDGWKLCGIHILPVTYRPLRRVAEDEAELKQLINASQSEMSGFYEVLDGDGYKLAVYQAQDSVFIVYVGHDSGDVGTWQFGEIKAILRPTAVNNIFKADWYLANKAKESALITFEDASMTIRIGTSKPIIYYKMGGGFVIDPNNGELLKEKWTGTGFAIGEDYIATNNHVVGEAQTIIIKGINGDMNMGFSAEVVVTDKANDIAIIRINDPNFIEFGTIPYAIQQRMADVGEDVFVLGYPITQALGNEIKLTNGIISSRTGYQGSISTYQMSAPVQPGNSGGPMFDNKGNVIGIVVAGVPGAENVGYAIKTSYLQILVESAGLNIKLPSNNTVSTLSLAEKVKRIKNFVFYIECSK